MSCEEKWKGYENETWKKQSEAESCRKERGLLMGKRCAVKKRFIDGGTARRWRRETHTKKRVVQIGRGMYIWEKCCEDEKQ